MMLDHEYVRVDESVIAEIELTGDLMIAASEHDGPLTQEELDLLLGV